MKNGILRILVLCLVVIAIWFPRGLALDHFLTADEPRWLIRSANFYTALSQGNFQETYQKEHPGVTIMWAGTLAFRWVFPWYISENLGQIDRPQDFTRFLENRGYAEMPMRLLEMGRTIIVLITVLTLALAFLAAVRLLGLTPALFGTLLIAFDPFSIALSRLLHPDALLSALMLCSVLYFVNFLYRGRHFYDLGIAAGAAGLAWLTKSPSFFLIPFFGLLSLIEITRSWWTKRRLVWRDIWRFSWPILVWAAMAALVTLLLWPAMWVDPIGSLGKIFQEAGNYAAEGHQAATFFNGEIFEAEVSDWRFYPINYLWRTTPVILSGLLLAGMALIFGRRLSFPREQQQGILMLLLFAAFYTIFMTLGAKKFDRYLAPIFPPLALVAATGWVVLLENAASWVSGKRNIHSSIVATIRYVVAGSLAILLLVQLVGTIETFPYYFTYYNPLMGGSKRAPEVMMIGWGEGLDEAARYISAKPDSDSLRVQSWYPIGPFSYIFNGQTIIKDFEADPRNLVNADYYVLYFHQWQRQRPSKAFMDYFDQQVPEHIVTIDGLEYARIYKSSELLPISASQ